MGGQAKTMESRGTKPSLGRPISPKVEWRVQDHQTIVSGQFEGIGHSQPSAPDPSYLRRLANADCTDGGYPHPPLKLSGTVRKWFFYGFRSKPCKILSVIGEWMSPAPSWALVPNNFQDVHK